MNRLFSKRQKMIMSMNQNNKCMKCNKKLNKNFHGDHVVPFSKNGSTILNNGQALCPKCNLSKGSKNV